MPKEIIGKYPNQGSMRRWAALLGVIVIVLIGSIVTALLGVINIPGIPVLLARVPHTQTPTFWLIPSVTETISQSTTTPSTTASPTGTDTPVVPTAVPPHLLETPIGTDPVLVLHNVEEGESFILLSTIYNTSAGAIQAINYNMGTSLFANRVIVIPMNTTDITGLPAFSVYEMINDGKTIEALATELKIDIVDLLKYNHLPEGYLLTKGEWLLIPR